MNISKDKLKFIAGGLVVFAAASLMLGPIIQYVSGLLRLITFIVSALLITYLVVTIITKMKGKDCSKSKSSCETTGSADQGTASGDVEV